MSYTQINTAVTLCAFTVNAVGAQLQTGGITHYSAPPYRDMAGESPLYPLLIFHSDNLYFEGFELGYTLHEGSDAFVNLLATTTQQGYKSSDSPHLVGMYERQRDLVAGVSFTYQPGKSGLSLKTTWDTSGAYTGTGTTLELFHRYLAGSQTLFEPYAGLDHLGSSKADYYYGVNPVEARPERPTYRLHHATNLYYGVNIVHSLDHSWRLFANLEQMNLDSEITSSPIVGQDRTLSAYLGVTYQW